MLKVKVKDYNVKLYTVEDIVNSLNNVSDKKAIILTRCCVGDCYHTFFDNITKLKGGISSLNIDFEYKLLKGKLIILPVNSLDNIYDGR